MHDTLGIGWGINPVLFFVLLVLASAIVWRWRGTVSALWLLPALVLYFGVLWYFPYDGWFKLIFWLACIVVFVTALWPWTGTYLAKWPLYMMTTVIVILAVLMPFRSWLADVGDEHAAKPGSSSLSDGLDASTSPSSSPEPEETESSSPSPVPTVTVTATVTPSPTPEVEDETSPPESTSDTPTALDERKYYGAPATIPGGTCPGMLGWDTLVDCVESNNLQWYVDGVNARASQTGFNWSDIELWAKAHTPEGNLPEARYIQVFGPGVSDAEAMERGRVMTGEDLRVVRQPALFSNTQGIEAGRMTDFDYDPAPEREVRVSLMPLKLNEDGEAVGVLNTRSGVFIDCLNVWWSKT